jgi:hypothetical protein
VNVEEKANEDSSGGICRDERKRTVDDVSKILADVKTKGVGLSWDQPGSNLCPDQVASGI